MSEQNDWLSANEALFGFSPRSSHTRAIAHIDHASIEPTFDPLIAACRARAVEDRRWAAVDHAINKQSEQYLMQNISPSTTLNPGDLVLVFDSVHAKEHGNKLHPKWKGPFRIRDRISPVLFRVASIDPNRSLPQQVLVHRDKLKKYFSRR